jgi:iron complex transport system substrate-binding protein
MRLLSALVLAVLVIGCGDDTETSQTERSGAGFPVTIEHKFGTTEIPDAPERVVAVGFNDQDFALALGVKPVGARQFQGGIDITDRPWAQDELAGTEPQIVGAEELELEKIAALRPDVILGVYSGLTKSEYATLSKIAPTVAQSGDYVDFGMPWQEQTETISRALGRESPGAKVVGTVEQQFARARERHPEFDGSSFVLASASAGKVFVYGSQDLRSRYFTSLGLRVPDAIEKLTGDSFYAQLGEENLRLLDQDLLVVYGTPGDVASLPLLKRFDVVREGRVVYLDATGDFANALGFSSPLSLPFALEHGVPRLAAALDGDPATQTR